MWGPAYLPGDQTFNNIDDFFQTGVQQKYDLSIKGGNEKSTYYLSASNNNQTGIVPEEDYNRFNLLLKGSTKITDNLTVSSSVNSIFSTNRRGGAGSMQSVYTWPTDNEMANYLRPNGTRIPLIEGLDNDFDNRENPYWDLKNNLPEYEINRTISQVFFDWDITQAIKATYRIGMDRSNQYFKQVVKAGSFGSRTRFEGTTRESEQESENITSTFNLSYSKMIGNDWNIYALFGSNIDVRSTRSINYSGRRFLLPSLTSINNVEIPDIPVQEYTERRVIGNYFDTKIDYKGIVSLGITGRQDWTSTIRPGENSFFYPSVTGGFVFSELLPQSITNFLSFGKLRASWAESGQDANPESLDVVLEQYPGIGNGYKHDFYAGNEFLIPESLVSYEFGGHLTFLNGRFDLDMAYYSTEARDMIINSRISTASGWVIQTFNSGNTENKGIELVLEADILKGGDLTWTASANFARNRSKLSKLPSFISRYPVTSGQIINEARPQGILGQPLYAIEGDPYLRNENGNVVIDEDGFPRVGTYVTDENGEYVLNSDGTRLVSQEKVYLGNREPDWLMGITNEFRYKDFSLSFLVDIRKGGDIINATASRLMALGLHESLNEDRNRVMVFKGEVETEEGFVPNTEQIVLDDSYFQFRYRQAGENFVEDGSWVRLRYVALTYDMSRIAKNWGMGGLNFTVTGRNLFILTNYSGGDPEKDFQGSAVGGPGTVGLDNFNVPTTQGITFSLRATF
ncbi:MAG: TonB-dependent receptor [Cyclobacteriaceae bacterium]